MKMSRSVIARLWRPKIGAGLAIDGAGGPVVGRCVYTRLAQAGDDTTHCGAVCVHGDLRLPMVWVVVACCLLQFMGWCRAHGTSGLPGRADGAWPWAHPNAGTERETRSKARRSNGWQMPPRTVRIIVWQGSQYSLFDAVSWIWRKVRDTRHLQRFRSTMG